MYKDKNVIYLLQLKVMTNAKESKINTLADIIEINRRSLIKAQINIHQNGEGKRNKAQKVGPGNPVQQSRKYSPLEEHHCILKWTAT